MHIITWIGAPTWRDVLPMAIKDPASGEGLHGHQGLLTIRCRAKQWDNGVMFQVT
jgi:hypothetical protein